MATGIGAVLLTGAPGGPKLTPTVSLFQVIGYNLLISMSSPPPGCCRGPVSCSGPGPR